MKDITNTTFGLIIAYLLPGLAALLTLAFAFPDVREMLEIFKKTESNIGLFLLVILAGIGLGLQVGVVRWLLIELPLTRWGWSLENADYRGLASEKIHAAFRTHIDEQYRYHQFFGGIAVIQPVFWNVFARGGVQFPQYFTPSVQWLLISIIEILTLLAAGVSWHRHVLRGKAILKSSQTDYAQRIPQTEKSQKSSKETCKESSEEEKVMGCSCDPWE